MEEWGSTGYDDAGGEGSRIWDPRIINECPKLASDCEDAEVEDKSDRKEGLFPSNNPMNNIYPSVIWMHQSG